MSLSNSAEEAWLDLLFLNLDWAGIGDAAGLLGSAVAGVFWVSLHTANPGESDDQTLYESAYSGYSRVSVVRSGAGWSRSGSTISNAAIVTFPTSGGAGGSTASAVGSMSADISVTGELLTTGNVGAAVWRRAIEAGFTAEEILRILAAHAAGAATGLEGRTRSSPGSTA